MPAPMINTVGSIAVVWKGMRDGCGRAGILKGEDGMAISLGRRVGPALQTVCCAQEGKGGEPGMHASNEAAADR